MGVVDVVLKRYGNYGDGDGSQVIPLCNVDKKFHMTYLSAVVVFCTLRAYLCRK